VTLEDDVAAAIAQVQREQGVGVSAAVNQLVRKGLTAKPARKRYVQKTSSMGAGIDVTNVGEVLELLEGPSYR